jgi:hypothetical protein
VDEEPLLHGGQDDQRRHVCSRGVAQPSG